jgi:hypothetical protein
MPKKVIPLSSELKNSKSPFDIPAEMFRNAKSASGQKVNKTNFYESMKNITKAQSNTTTNVIRRII